MAKARGIKAIVAKEKAEKKGHKEGKNRCECGRYKGQSQSECDSCYQLAMDDLHALRMAKRTPRDIRDVPNPEREYTLKSRASAMPTNSRDIYDKLVDDSIDALIRCGAGKTALIKALAGIMRIMCEPTSFVAIED